MNKLYILGALALANVEAYIHFGGTPGATTPSLGIATSGVAGTYTYTIASDCYEKGTATSLGMNNIYHQYYSFSLTKGTITWSTMAVT